MSAIFTLAYLHRQIPKPVRSVCMISSGKNMGLDKVKTIGLEYLVAMFAGKGRRKTKGRCDLITTPKGEDYDPAGICACSATIPNLMLINIM